ncbi:MAG TPA: winged helix-turn-helix domain-containing protein [Xanthobacteraceae bacterium]|jgi:predicted ATPase/DNA-binding winged helix-turn-helix (wHTH) protein|nr:winged helix-turn-helix domain-containing protein [Xanthobacteraceae bacterium]
MSEAFVFGPFRLLVARRELLAHGVPVTMGQRAFEILLTLVSRHGQLVTKDELMAEVWPGVVVEENNIQVHISAVRKVLAAAGDGDRYLLTVAGRGYRFLAPVTRESPGEPKTAGVDDQSAPAGADIGAATNNLPQQLTSLIGREADLAEIKARLRDHRLVTLTGSGGVGKTRLSIEAGRSLLDRYLDGVWLAELAPLNDAQLVTSIVADALGVSLSATAGGLDTLTSALRTKQLLLIIDNCEHVIAEAARVAEALMRGCPRLSILASSRERMAIAGESVIRVPSLPAPQPDEAATAARACDYAAVRLFVERANALGCGFALTDANAATVASICRRLDGIPLAIELAVPRLKVLPVDKLARGLDERFRLLTGGSRTALPRQQTLHALIDWSYGLLSDAEKTLLARLSVFLGTTSLASISSVVGGDDMPPEQIGDLLLSLVEKSLVHADLDSNDSRYGLLESTRYFAAEKLADAPALRRRHAEHFAARFAQATSAWETTPTREWIASYASDVDNLRGALDWAFGPDGDVAVGLDLVAHSHILWAELGLMLEHRYWVVAALEKLGNGTPPKIAARLLSWQAGDVRELDDPADYEEAMRAADLYRKLGDSFHEGRVLLRAGTARLSPDSAEEGERLLREAHALVRPFGTTKTLAHCLSALASARLFAGDLSDAHSLHRQALDVYRDLGEGSDDRATF